MALSNSHLNLSAEQALERFALAAEAVRALIYDWDIETDAIYRSPGLFRLVGFHPDEVPPTGEWWSARIHPEDLPGVRAAMEHRASEDDDLFHLEYRVLHKNGEYIYAWDHGVVIRDATGKPVRVVGSTFDITERKRLEEQAHKQAQEVEAQRALLETLFESLPIGISYFDTNMRVVYANARREELMGTEREAAIGQSIYDTSTRSEARRHLYEQALAGQSNVYRDTPYQHPDGTSRYYDVVHTPVRDKSGKVIGFISSIDDVTERKRAEERLQLLSRLSEQIRLAPDVDELTWSAAREVGEFLGVKRCFFTEIDLVSDTANVRRNYCNGVPSVVGLYKVSSYSPITQTEMKSGRTVVNCDSRTDERTASFYEATYEKFGERSYIAVPLMRDSLWVGALWVSDDVPRQWTGDEVSLVETVAERVWLAVEKLRSEQALYASEQQLTTILEQLPVGVSVFDSDGETVLLNSVMRRFVTETMPSRDPESMQRWRAWTTEGQPLPSSEWPSARALRGERVIPGMEFLFTDDDGRNIWTYVTSVPLRDAEGAVVGAITVVEDIDERKQAQQRRDEFIALAAHEMRTPLTAIKGFSQSLLRTLSKEVSSDNPNNRMMRALQIIDNKADFLNQLINDMLDVARIERGELRQQQEPFDLAPVVDEVVSNQALSAPEFEFTLAIPSQTVPVVGDRNRIEQVLTNLINNAVKYSGNSRRVEISVEMHDNEAVVAVTDYGVGIPAYEQERVFERYFQATNATRAHQSGLGLGLYISHGIITRHGGRMWLVSALDRGSTFYFSLPLEASYALDPGEGG